MITLKLDDPTAYTYLQIASCYEKLENANLAIKFYHNATEEDPLLEQAWLAVTSLYMDSDNLEKALHYIKEALDVDSDNSDYLNRYAEICVRLNLYEEAALAFKKSIINGDKRLVVYLALCDILHFLGDFNDAKVVLNDAITEFPNAAELFYRFAGILFLLRQDKEAFKNLELGLKKDSSYLEVATDIFHDVFSREDIKQFIAKHKS